jgi:hypothetical protein
MHLRHFIVVSTAILTLPAQGQQYIEWISPTGDITCDSIAVAPELDERLRRHEFEATTALRVTVDLEGRFSAPVVIERSGTAREHIVLDRHALANAVKCKLTVKDPGSVGQTRRVEYQWNFRSPTPLQVK